MIFTNIDSPLFPSTAGIDLIRTGKREQLLVLQNVPVLWVSEALMDKLYDPWRNVFMDEAEVEKLVKGAIEGKKDLENIDDDEKTFDSEMEAVNDFWDKIEKCRKPRGMAYRPAQGLYIDSLAASNHAELAKASKKNGKSNTLPAIGQSVILVCPTRCAHSASLVSPTTFNASEGTDLVIAQTTLHETIHGYLRTPQARYDTAWGRLIEESLCDALSAKNFTDRESISALNDLFSNAVLEYRSYIFWNQEDDTGINVLAEWKYFSIFNGFRRSRFRTRYIYRNLPLDDLIDGLYQKIKNKKMTAIRATEMYFKALAREILVFMQRL